MYRFYVAVSAERRLHRDGCKWHYQSYFAIYEPHHGGRLLANQTYDVTWGQAREWLQLQDRLETIGRT